MPDRDAYLHAWEPDNVIRFPREQWMSEFAAPAAAYPDIDFIPIDMSAVFTSYLPGPIDLYAHINLDFGSGEPTKLVIIGAVPADHATLMCLDQATGRILMIGTKDGTLELVNSTFKALVEYLYHFARFIDEDTGHSGRAMRAIDLRDRLVSIDPGAFTDPESWWSVAFMQLEGRTR